MTTQTELHPDHTFVGHPRGLAYISFTEAWERFSYYGMQTLLVLYMVHQLLLPGHIENIAGFSVYRGVLENMYGHTLSTIALASAIFGMYTGFVYMTPVIGGLIADRWLGKTKTITIGALLMAAGHFLMAFDVSFLLALLCLLIGVGLFKGNLASQVSELYAPEDMRRADAYQIYFLFINAAVIIAPLVTGTLGESKDYGWHYGFGAAGIGMLISLAVYLYGRKWLPKEQTFVAKHASIQPNSKLTAREWKTLILLICMLPVLAVGSIGNQEIFNAYLLWIPANINLVFFGQVMPTTWLITVDAVVSVSGLLGAMAFWRWYAKRYTEPSEIAKMTIGMGLGAIALLCLAAAASLATPDNKAGIGWVLGFEIFNSMGFANLFPVGLALYARVSPKTIAGTLMGVYYLHLFICNNLVGWLGGLLERLPGTQFWLLHAGLVATAMVVIFGIARVFGRYLLPVQPSDATKIELNVINTQS